VPVTVQREKDFLKRSEKPSVFYQKRLRIDDITPPDTETDFRRIVSLAKSKRNDEQEQASRMLNHLSRARRVGLDAIDLQKISVPLMRIVVEFEIRLKN